MAKDIQREIEAHNLLAQQFTMDENDHAIIVDIADRTVFLPSINNPCLIYLLASPSRITLELVYIRETTLLLSSLAYLWPCFNEALTKQYHDLIEVLL